MDKQGAAALWEKASQLIKSEINSVSYDYWFQDLQPADWDGEKLTLMADNDFGRNLLKEKYDELIRTALQRAAGRPVSYVILTPAEAAAPVSSMAANSAQILFFIVFPSIRKRPAPFLLFGSAFHAKSR